MDIEKLRSFYGKIHEFITPSGYTMIIREQNGNDDDVITKTGNSNINSINAFIQGIIIYCELFPDVQQLSMAQLMALKLRDKYITLLQSRIFSLGNILNFSYDWKVPGRPPFDYTEDLNKYIWDYSTPFPQLGDKEYFKYRTKPYANGLEIEKELLLSSTKKVKYQYLSGISEKTLLDRVDNDITINDELRARGFQWEVKGTWMIVENFKDFSPKDMIEIRNDVNAVDEKMQSLTEIENPLNGTIVTLPLLGISDFFFPREI